MARINVRNNIDIERNPVEKFLMKVKDVITGNRKLVLYSFISLLIAVVLLIVSSIIFEKRSESQMVRYETIMQMYQIQGTENPENIEKTIAELKKLHGSSYFGFVHHMSLYSAGNLYYSVKKYKEAEEALISFAGSTPSELFAALALLKASSAAEERADLDRAIEIYKTLEGKYLNGILDDQILYNMGRVYGLKNDKAMAKKYYNNIIMSYPQSPLAEKAKKRMLLLGLPK